MTPTPITAGDTLTVTVTGTTTPSTYVNWNNHCTTSGDLFACTPVRGQEQVFDSDTEAQLSLVSGTTYSASTRVDRPGDVSVNLWHTEGSKIYAEYYPTQDFSGQPNFGEYLSSTLDYSFPSEIYSGVSGDFSVAYTFMFTTTTAGNYTFILTSSHKSDLEIDGVKVIDNTSPGEGTHNVNIVAGRVYNFVVHFTGDQAPANIKLYYSITTTTSSSSSGGSTSRSRSSSRSRSRGATGRGLQTSTTTPAQIPISWLSTNVRFMDPIQVTVGCPSGQSKVLESGRPV